MMAIMTVIIMVVVSIVAMSAVDVLKEKAAVGQA